MKYKFLTNFCIVTMLFSLFCITYDNGIKSVFSQNDSEPYYCGDANQPQISLMINVYWGNEFIEPMLQILEENQIETTFFVGGSWANKYSDLLHKIINKGHEIGNHGYNHKEHSKLNYEQNYNEINMCHQVVKSLGGVEMTLFAPPSGDFSKTTLQVASALNYKTIMWSKDTIDWRDKNPELIFKRATNKLKNGDLVLMHPTQSTLEALPNIIKKANEMQLKIVSVSKCLNGK